MLQLHMRTAAQHFFIFKGTVKRDTWKKLEQRGSREGAVPRKGGDDVSNEI